MSEPAAVLRIRASSVRDAVIERVVGALAARADLPVDRLSDAQIVATAAGEAAAPHVADGVLEMVLSADAGVLSVRLGPIEAGTARRIVVESAVPGVGTVIEALADRWSVEAMDDRHERLDLEIRTAAQPAR